MIIIAKMERFYKPRLRPRSVTARVKSAPGQLLLARADHPNTSLKGMDTRTQRGFPVVLAKRKKDEKNLLK